MATKNQSGISIKIEAFLPTGSTIEEQYTALSMVRDAQSTGDYSAVLAASTSPGTANIAASTVIAQSAMLIGRVKKTVQSFW